jgi:hypothetical protein
MCESVAFGMPIDGSFFSVAILLIGLQAYTCLAFAAERSLELTLPLQGEGAPNILEDQVKKILIADAFLQGVTAECEALFMSSREIVASR